MCVASAETAQASRYEILYRFGANHDAYAPTAPVVVAADGMIYGTTEGYLGAHPYHHGGTVFALDTNGHETQLWRLYTRRAGPAFPVGNLIVDPGGALIGATQYGGSRDYHICYRGCGVVFSLQPGGSITFLRTFGRASRRRESVTEGLYPAG